MQIKDSSSLGATDDSRDPAHERGDVPGWVLITLMTAGLVIVIWGLAGPALSNVFQQAIDRVTGF
jgi:hypothetical protein